ncbi:hypothetical protein SERLA73DRAFT_74799 [Serpula lacrymans var. lacrymans S7.3]|uniref:Uncharacterized protein n=1 Tax=Serpula lacrymans var. lacrymans (strain S7.3) TaxID=936435 RepID=F8Q3K1_SERL3|nr:hypothetical protein SERLA73DRAFT_74799 [Serpula lacrymans var. lacrymans S7.3]
MDKNKENCTDSIVETIGKDGKDSDTTVIPTDNLTQKRRLNKRDNNISNINEQILESTKLTPPNPKRRKAEKSESGVRVSQDLEETLQCIEKNLEGVGRILKEDIGGAIREQTEVLKRVLHEYAPK